MRIGHFYLAYFKNQKMLLQDGVVNNIKGIKFDADNTIIDHRDCERQAREK